MPAAGIKRVSLTRTSLQRLTSINASCEWLEGKRVLAATRTHHILNYKS